MALRLITAPTVYPLSLTQVKQHLRVDHSYDDDLITLYLNAATSHVDAEHGFLGRALVEQTWELVIDEFPENEIKIPLPPLQSVVSIKYDDGDGTEQTLSTSEYTVDTSMEPGWVVPPAPGGWPTTFEGINAVRIQFVAGYPATADSPPDVRANIPASIRQAILLHVGSMYANRENFVIGVSISPIPFSAENLLRPWRVVVPFA